MRVLAAVSLILLGCASASTGKAEPGKDGGVDTGGGDDDDGPSVDMFVPPIDMGPTTIKLSQTANELTDGSTPVCSSGDTFTAENSWYRVFQPSAMGVPGPFTITNVGFIPGRATGSPMVQVRIGTHAGAPGGTLGTITNLASASVIAATAGTPLDVPITVPAGALPANTYIVVEIFSPDHTGTTQFFFPSASAGTETAPSYVRAPTCNVTAPINAKTASATSGAVVISLTGTY